MADLVSILIPVYNAEEWLADTLECALEQTWSNKEVIVVDDGSTDSSVEIARRYEGPNVKVISQENQGACAARNRALAHAKGDYIQYLDADDLMAPNKIELQIKRLSTEAPGTIATCKWERFYDTKGHPSPSKIHFQDKSFYGEYDSGLEWAITTMSQSGMFPTSTWLVPTKVVEVAGLWDESLLINQDGEYFNRISLKSRGIVFCPSAKVYYRSGIEDSVSQRRSKSVLISQYRSLEMITNQILDKEDSARTREACAIAYQAFLEEAYPNVPEVVDKAVAKVEKLGGCENYTPKGSGIYKTIYNTLGWRAAKILRTVYYLIRHNRWV